jgi:transposase
MTSPWKTRTELDHQIVLLSSRGNSMRQIARALGISRGLVRRALGSHVDDGRRPHTVLPSPEQPVAPRPSKLDVFEPRIRELLEMYPTITAQRILEEIKAAGYDGGHAILRERVRKLRPRSHPSLRSPGPYLRPVRWPSRTGHLTRSSWAAACTWCMPSCCR